MSAFTRACLLGLALGVAPVGMAWAEESAPAEAAAVGTAADASASTPAAMARAEETVPQQVAAPEPVVDAGRMPEGDPARGRLIFGQCRACHYPEPAMGHNNGPNLHRIFGKVAGKQEGFEYYSKTFREAQFVWTPELLWLWLADPLAMFPGTTMMSLGIPDPQERADLVAYLMRASVRGVDEPGADMSSPYSGTETATDKEKAPWPP